MNILGILLAFAIGWIGAWMYRDSSRRNGRRLRRLAATEAADTAVDASNTPTVTP